MQSESGQTTPVWSADADVPDFPALASDLDTEVCIVGAGIAGLSVAYHLARAGRRVVVLDDGPVGGGETGRTTAHLANAIDDRFYEVERLFGQDGSRLAAESHGAAIDRIEQIVRDEAIDCDFARLDGYLFLAVGDTADELDKELEAAHRAGLTAVERVDRAALREFDTGPALRFPRQGQFHILKYLAGLARAVEKHGGRIFTGTHVRDIDGGKRGAGASVTTSDGHTVKAGSIVVATNTPVNDRFVIHTKQAPYRTYVVALRVPKDSVPLALYWDTGDPYHYVRLQSHGDHDALIVGGEDHKTGQADDMDERWRALEEWTRARFPMAERVEARWSGQVMEPVDYMAFIGRNPADEDNVYIATGDSGQGMTHGTIAGMLIADLITGTPNPWEKLYAPNRVTLGMSSAMEYAKENLNVVAQYADLVRGGDVDSADAIEPGEGAVLRRGAKKVAVYRDEDGTLHERSAICPHLFCVVDWNHGEKTWDCPCHGSRFDRYGKVVNGPSIVDLPAVEE
jgi:glycine/D-amino acid oxidase-like deaminating enzyme/nitrite reductase/ring-hydroxylating ferredoxin subunit